MQERKWEVEGKEREKERKKIDKENYGKNERKKID